MNVRFVRVEDGHAIVMGHAQLDLTPVKGQRVVWKDDLDYVIKCIAWDFVVPFNCSGNEPSMVVELKRV